LGSVIAKQSDSPEARRVLGRTIVIGDIHGCARELDALLEELEPTTADQVVCVGDLVAKGPDSVQVVRILREVGARSVLGNHDANLIDFARGRRPGTSVHETVRKAVKKLRDEELAWLEALPYVIELPEHGALVVHGGLVPNVPVPEQLPVHALTLRSIRPNGTPSKRIEDGVPWASLWPGPEHVYFGHDAVRGLQRQPFATGLDSGCVYGGRLSAMVLPDRELVSVRAKRVYAEPGRSYEAAAREKQGPR
jgi:predicted phosphodiesterase